MTKIKLLVGDKIFELDSSILFKFKYFKKLLKKYDSESGNTIDFTNKKINICPNEFRNAMKYAKNPTHKLKKKHEKCLKKLGLIDEYDLLVDKLSKNTEFVGKINDCNTLYGFFKFIEKLDTAVIKSTNDKLILNILSGDDTSFTHIELLLDKVYGSINKPICITHEKLNIINKLSPKNPILIYLQNNKLNLFTKTNNIDIKWNMCQNNNEEYFEEPPKFNYLFGFKAPIYTLQNIAKMDSIIKFDISNRMINIKCGSFNASVKQKCNKSFSIEFQTKNLINYLKNLPIKNNVTVFLKKNLPLKIVHADENQLTEFYLSS